MFPCAVAEVGDATGVRWRAALGAITFDKDAARAAEDTCFDLASLTKPLATTTVLLSLLESGRLDLDEPVAGVFPEWRGDDRASVTVRDLLEHAAGLPARLIDRPPASQREFEHEICAAPLEYAPRTRTVYSDLGFILLGFLAAVRGRASLDQLFDSALAPLHGFEGRRLAELGFSPANGRIQFAPTEPLDDDARRGRRLVGEVHDNYAAALGGVAGHAGLFGTAGGVGVFARSVLISAQGRPVQDAPLSPALLSLATRRSGVEGSSRALGWDTMLVTSSCGRHMSPQAFGHVGFTGTSLWIDPVRDRYFVLLTNRACGGGSLEDMRTVRRAFHDAFAG